MSGVAELPASFLAAVRREGAGPEGGGGRGDGEGGSFCLGVWEEVVGFPCCRALLNDVSKTLVNMSMVYKK